MLLATPRAAAAVRIYDATTPRPSDLLVGAHSYDSLQWGADPSTLYAVDPSTPETLLILGVGPAGASLLQTSAAWSTPSIAGIHYDAGLIYADSGQVIDPASGKIVGNYGASGLVLPDSTLNTLFILGQTAAQAGTQNYTLESFNQKTCSPIASLAIDNLVGAPTGLIRWGSRGLAFTTSAATSSTFPFVSGPGRLYIISSGSFVSAADAIHPAGTATLQPVHQTWVHTQPPPPPQPSTRPAEP